MKNIIALIGFGCVVVAGVGCAEVEDIDTAYGPTNPHVLEAPVGYDTVIIDAPVPGEATTTAGCGNATPDYIYGPVSGQIDGNGRNRLAARPGGQLAHAPGHDPMRATVSGQAMAPASEAPAFVLNEELPQLDGTHCDPYRAHGVDGARDYNVTTTARPRPIDDPFYDAGNALDGTDPGGSVCGCDSAACRADWVENNLGCNVCAVLVCGGDIQHACSSSCP